MLEYIDSHAHYDDIAFDSDRDALLDKIHNGGVLKIVNVGCNIERSRISVEYSQKYPFIFAAVGIHPEDSAFTPDNYADEIKRLAALPKSVAIGEIGLDYHSDGFDRPRQLDFFDKQLLIAEELSLPVIIHSRDAYEDTMRVLNAHKGKVRGVMHCFSGSAQAASEVLALGFNISFTGVLTFKNARRAVEALRVIPIERLMVETDCPYMAPEPFRGSRCDSSMIVSVINKIAADKNISPEAAADMTMNNTLDLFYKMK